MGTQAVNSDAEQIVFRLRKNPAYAFGSNGHFFAFFFCMCEMCMADAWLLVPAVVGEV